MIAHAPRLCGWIQRRRRHAVVLRHRSASYPVAHRRTTRQLCNVTSRSHFFIIPRDNNESNVNKMRGKAER